MKFKAIFLLTVMMIIIGSPTGLAIRWSDILSRADEIKLETTYEGITSQNGMKITCDNLRIGAYPGHGQPENTCLGTRAQALCVNGMNFTFTNTTKNMLTIDWKNSIICLDNTSMGMPFLSGMKYKDAGNLDVMQNTILPPGTSVTKSILIPNVKFDRSYGWFIKGALLFKDRTRKFDFYISVNSSDGTTEYVHLDIPPVVTPAFDIKY